MGRLIDRSVPVILVGCVFFLGFVAGAYVVLSERFPYPFFRAAYSAARSVVKQRREEAEGPYGPSQSLWRHARTSQRGVTVYDPTQASDGYTLYTSGHKQSAFLIDMHGRLLHEWHMPFSQVWNESAAVKEPADDSRIFYFKAVLYPDGGLLAIYDGAGQTPHGYGLVRLDRDSRVLWSYLQHVHHAVEVAPDGSIYVLTHQIGTHEVQDRAYLRPPRIDDYVVQLSPRGEELRKVPILEALSASPFGVWLNEVPWHVLNNGDLLHTNDIEYVDAATAARFPFLSPGEVVLSLREPALIGALDLQQQKFTWAVRGPWLGQHDPDLLPNGHVLLFDNRGHTGPGGASRILELEPQTLEIVWSYTGDDRQPFDSGIRSAQQRLPNGNTLITESDGGRIFEVTADGGIVWEFINPVRGGEDDGFIPVVWAERISPQTLAPDFLESLQRTVERSNQR